MYNHTTEVWRAWEIFSILTPPCILLIRTFQHINQCSQTVSSLTPPPLKKSLMKYLTGTDCHLLLVSHPLQEPRYLGLQNCSLSSLVLSLLPVWVLMFGEQILCILLQDNFPELCEMAETVLLGWEIAVCGLLGMHSLKGKEKWEGLTGLVY